MSQLTTNTTTINECIALANSLPDAGSSGGGSTIETCNVEFALDAPPDPGTIVYSVDAYGNLQETDLSFVSITIQKNTIIAIEGWSGMSSTSGASGNVQLLFYNSGYAAFFVTGDCTLTYG